MSGVIETRAEASRWDDWGVDEVDAPPPPPPAREPAWNVADLPDDEDADEVVVEAREPVSTIDPVNPIPGLRRIVPGDVDGLGSMLRNVWRVREAWDAAALQNPALWFMHHYTNPANLIFDIADGAGFIAFLKTIPYWSTQVYFGAWGRAAMRRHDLWRAAASIAMLANDLHVIHGFIFEGNTLSRRMAERCGMRARGRIPRGGLYNGVVKPMVWYEIDRDGLGLGPVEDRE